MAQPLHSQRKDQGNPFRLPLDRQEILYYCEVDEGSNLRIHRGDKSGPIIAEVNTCLVTPGGTDVHLADPLRTVELLHLPHGDTSQTRFSIDDKRYHWKGHSELLDDDTEVKMAQFYPSWHVIEVKEHKIGTLFIYGDTPRDLSVITALVVQERSDEARQAVCWINRPFLISD